MDHEYTIDSILLKKNFKLDLSVSLDSLPACVHAVKKPRKLKKEEAEKLSKNFVYFRSHESKNTWFWQDDRIYFYNRSYYDTYIGPFDTSKVLNYFMNGVDKGSIMLKQGYALKYNEETEAIWNF